MKRFASFFVLGAVAASYSQAPKLSGTWVYDIKAGAKVNRKPQPVFLALMDRFKLLVYPDSKFVMDFGGPNQKATGTWTTKPNKLVLQIDRIGGQAYEKVKRSKDSSRFLTFTAEKSGHLKMVAPRSWVKQGSGILVLKRK